MVLQQGNYEIEVQAGLTDPHEARALFSTPRMRPKAISVSANYPLDQTGTPWLPASLPLAMKAGRNLHIAGAVDETAAKNAAGAQEIIHGWFPNFERIEVSVDGHDSGAATPERGVGCFFSGGVDSFYSAVTRSEDITHLIFVTGFDIDIKDGELAKQALDGARAAAGAMGKQLVEVSTNIRTLSNKHVNWGPHYHGAALASVGLLLSKHIHTAIIPASYYVDDLYPWGSHPELDHYWSSSKVSFEHHGTDVTRPQKVIAIGNNPAAMDHLRVCWRNPDGAFNCGKCEKCLRTMVNLRIAGALGRCKTLPETFDIEAIRRPGATRLAKIYARENLAAFKASGLQDPELAAALEELAA
jgi:hypothetical protein